MATSTIETVRRLLELAGNIPTNDTPEYRAEREQAAYQAARLIVKFSLPVGDNVINRSDKEWVPPPQEFYDTVADLFRGKSADPDWDASKTQTTGGLVVPETELQDQKSAFAQQVVTAWRAIRETRKALQGEVYRYEQRTGKRFDPTIGRGLADWTSSRMSPIVGSEDWMFRDDYGVYWRLHPSADPDLPLQFSIEQR